MSRKYIRVAKVKITPILILLIIFVFVTPVWVIGNFEALGWYWGLYYTDAEEFNWVALDEPLFGISVLSSIFIIASLILLIIAPILAKRIKSMDKYSFRVISGILIIYGLVIYLAGIDLEYPGWWISREISIWGYLPFIIGPIAIISGLIYMITKRTETKTKNLESKV